MGMMWKYYFFNKSTAANEQFELLKFACDKHLNTFTPAFKSKIFDTTRFLERNNISFVFNGGSALGIERFGLLLCPWDDDIDVGGVSLDAAMKLFTPKFIVDSHYEDISHTDEGQNAAVNHCEIAAHKGVCIGFKFYRIGNDCLSFEALNWGFLQSRYHYNCTKNGKKTMDIFLSNQCDDEETHLCQLSRNAFQWYIQKLNSGKKLSNGLTKAAVEFWRGPKEMRLIENGMRVPVLKENKKYLSVLYGQVWMDEVLICPHNIFGTLGSCMEEAHSIPMKDVLIAMKEISSCSKIMKNATVNAADDFSSSILQI